MATVTRTQSSNTATAAGTAPKTTATTTNKSKLGNTNTATGNTTKKPISDTKAASGTESEKEGSKAASDKSNGTARNTNTQRPSFGSLLNGGGPSSLGGNNEHSLFGSSSNHTPQSQFSGNTDRNSILDETNKAALKRGKNPLPSLSMFSTPSNSPMEGFDYEPSNHPSNDSHSDNDYKST